MNKGEPFARPSPFPFSARKYASSLLCQALPFKKTFFRFRRPGTKSIRRFPPLSVLCSPRNLFYSLSRTIKNGAINRISAKISVLFLFPRRSKTRRFHSGFPYRKTGVFICAKISPAAASAFSPRSLRFSVQTSARLFAFFPFPFL